MHHFFGACCSLKCGKNHVLKIVSPPNSCAILITYEIKALYLLHKVVVRVNSELRVHKVVVRVKYVLHHRGCYESSLCQGQCLTYHNAL